MGFTGSYDLKQCFLVVGGIRIKGFGEGDVIKITPRADIGDVTVGAGGSVAFFRNNNNVHNAEVILLSTTKGYKQLYEMLQAQKAEEEISRLRFSLEDANNGDKVVDQNAIFMKEPEIVKGSGGAPSYTFTIILPDPSRTGGANNTSN